MASLLTAWAPSRRVVAPLTPCTLDATNAISAVMCLLHLECSMPLRPARRPAAAPCRASPTLFSTSAPTSLRPWVPVGLRMKSVPSSLSPLAPGGWPSPQSCPSTVPMRTRRSADIASGSSAEVSWPQSRQPRQFLSAEPLCRHGKVSSYERTTVAGAFSCHMTGAAFRFSRAALTR